MNTRTMLIALMTFSVALAGCTSSTDEVDPEVDLTKGTISGLLVDDNFRPIQLKEEFPNAGDFQDEGFILLVETGQRFETTENGEFEIVGLPAGKYTLKVAAQFHEAVERTVDVEAAETTAVTVEARRKASGSNPILTIEYSGFVPCATADPTGYSSADCSTDLNGETFRPGPVDDFRLQYGNDAHYIVIEAVTNQPGGYLLVFRESDLSNAGLAGSYARTDAADPNNPYMKLVLENSGVYADSHNPRFKGQNDGSMRCDFEGEIETHEEGDYCSWDNTPDAEGNHAELEALVFYTGESAGEAPTPEPFGPTDVSAGFKAGLKYNYLISIFIGDPTPTDDDPSNDLEDYCVYCKGYLDEL